MLTVENYTLFSFTLQEHHHNTTLNYSFYKLRLVGTSSCRVFQMQTTYIVIFSNASKKDFFKEVSKSAAHNIIMTFKKMKM